MSSRPTVGIMITKDDADIAAWFNMMKGHNPAKWVSGMLAAWSMGESLEGGTVVLKQLPKPVLNFAPVPSKFGYGRFSSPSQPTPKYTYGWNVRAADGTYTEGSVINLSIARQEIQPIVAKLKSNRTQLAPFIKSLIRSNISLSSHPQLPDISALTSVMSRYRLSLNGQSPASQPETSSPSLPAPNAQPHSAPEQSHNPPQPDKMSSQSAEPLLKRVV